MWLSADYALNDSTERSWGYSIFGRAVKQVQDELGAAFVKNITSAVNASFSHGLLMISSYSLDPDVLSQWRAYADDGRGFAIGFSESEMKMPAKRLRVLYDEAAQLKELSGNIRHTYEYEKSIGFKYDLQFHNHWFNIGADLCAYKNPSFREEREIRCVHGSGLVPHNKSLKIVPLGALDQDGKRLSNPIDVYFRIRNGVIIPYVVLDYSRQGENSPVKEVILGPRNDNSERNVEIFLNTVGLADIAVRRSSVPYR